MRTMRSMMIASSFVIPLVFLFLIPTKAPVSGGKQRISTFVEASTGRANSTTNTDPFAEFPSSAAQFQLDTRPISPKGLLCIDGHKGRLNNIIVETMVGMNFARHINRTFAVPSEISDIFDMSRLSLSIPDEEYIYKPIVLWNEVAQDHNMTCKKSKYTIHKELEVTGRFEAIDETTKDLSLLSVHNNDIWYWLGRPPESFYSKFFNGLAPNTIIQLKVQTFLSQTFGPDQLFNSVHLRWLEGVCPQTAESKELCCPDINTTNQILISRGADVSLPMFVASDGQCPQNILSGYEQNNATVGYSDQCEGNECAIIDFEITVWSQYFLGNLASSGDLNIREWRFSRAEFPGPTSILSLKNSTVARENATALTRYWAFHNGWISDCSDLSARKRRGRVCA